MEIIQYSVNAQRKFYTRRNFVSIYGLIHFFSKGVGYFKLHCLRALAQALSLFPQGPFFLKEDLPAP